jgi:hypothetical protein
MRQGMLVTDNFFSVLGIVPSLGRTFLPEEGRGTVKGSRRGARKRGSQAVNTVLIVPTAVAWTLPATVM